MKSRFGWIHLVFSLLFVSCASVMNAQDIKDVLREQIRQSITTPDMSPMQHQPYQMEQQRQQGDILKVSPFTKLPTRGDRIKVLHPPEEYKIHINTNVTNSTPIDQLPPGSVRYEFVGKNMQMIPTAGTRPYPAGIDRGPIRKRHKKSANILKAFQK